MLYKSVYIVKSLRLLLLLLMLSLRVCSDISCSAKIILRTGSTVLENVRNKFTAFPENAA